jgi:hypothetical protein
MGQDANVYVSAHAQGLFLTLLCVAHEGQVCIRTIVLENYMHTTTPLVFDTAAVVQQFAVCRVDRPVQGVATRGIHAPPMQGVTLSNPRLRK